MAIGHQSFYQSQLTTGISDTDLIIPLDTVPTPSEGFLVIEGDVEAKREIIYYTSKDGTSVTVPSGAGNGRGYDGTTAVEHLQGAAVVMAPVGAMFEKLGDITVNSITINDTTSAEGWSPLGDVPDTVTANGNGSYDLVFNGNDLTDTVSEGMRVRTARTVAAPDQCTSLNGTTQYYSKSSPSGMTFTDDFVVSAWVKLSSYPTSAMTIASRYNGTSGWDFRVDSAGKMSMSGFNAGSANESYVISYQSLPLNKWVHVAVQLDMSAFTATTTTSYMMIDGVDVPAIVGRAGTNPTSLIQAGNLEIGSRNGGLLPFAGKIAQVAIYSAKVTQATHLAAMNQGLTGSETSLISAYSFDNAITDLAATGNDLTANGSAVATENDSPFGNSGVSTTIDYGILMAKSFSTNTTLTVQVPEGCTIPTSGGVTSIEYSTADVPYGFPRAKSRWDILVAIVGGYTTANNGGTIFTRHSISVPAGEWELGYNFNAIQVTASSTTHNARYGLATTSALAPSQSSPFTTAGTLVNATEFYPRLSAKDGINLAAQTVYYLNAQAIGANFTQHGIMGMPGKIYAKNAYI